MMWVLQTEVWRLLCIKCSLPGFLDVMTNYGLSKPVVPKLLLGSWEPGKCLCGWGEGAGTVLKR